MGVYQIPLLGIYQYHRDIHEHNTRQNIDPRILSVNSVIMRKSFLSQCPKLWASLDDHLKASRTKSSLKVRLNDAVLCCHVAELYMYLPYKIFTYLISAYYMYFT